MMAVGGTYKIYFNFFSRFVNHLILLKGALHLHFGTDILAVGLFSLKNQSRIILIFFQEQCPTQGQGQFCGLCQNCGYGSKYSCQYTNGGFFCR